MTTKRATYSSLRLSGISDHNCKHAFNVYDKFKCSEFLDYHMLYLKCDVLLLADVFEKIRKTSISHSKLDPANYITIAYYARDAMLLKTGIALYLIADAALLEKVGKNTKTWRLYICRD